MGHDPVDRRTFLGLAGGAAGLLATPGRASAALPDEHEALEHTFRVEDQILAGSTAPRVVTAAGWDADKLFNQAALTLLWSGRIAEASPELLRTEGFQAEVDARSQGIADTLWALALQLDEMSDDDIASLEADLANNPWYLDEMRLNFTARALENDVSLEAVGRIDKLFKEALWRIRKRGMAAVRDKYVGQLDKYAKRQGIDWRAEARRGANRAFVRDDVPGTVKGKRRAKRLNPTTSEAAYRIAQRKQTAGIVEIAVGGIWVGAWPYGTLIGGICFGPPLIVSGIIQLTQSSRYRQLGDELYEKGR